MGLNTINSNTVSINNKLLGEMIVIKLSTVYKRIELLSLVRQTSMLTITLIDQE